MAEARQETLVCPGCGYYQAPERFAEEHVLMAATRVMKYGEGRGKGGIRWEKRALTEGERALLHTRLRSALREIESTGVKG